jgi:hypothetical protein
VPKFGYLVVEGPHDVEIVAQLLRPHGLARVQFERDLDAFFLPLVPRTYPPNGDLLKRVPVPLFLQSATHVVAVHSAVGDTRLIATIVENAVLLDMARLSAIGVLIDSDDVSPIDRYNAIRDGLRVQGYQLHAEPGEVKAGSTRLGGFVLPDNSGAGNLEDILLDCAHHVYPGLLATATTHVDSASQDISLTERDLKETRSRAGRHKAIVGSIASVLRPGKAVQVSLQDNRWLRDTALALPRVRAIQQFLLRLLELA